MLQLAELENTLRKKLASLPPPTEKEILAAHSRWRIQVRWCNELRRVGVNQRSEMREDALGDQSVRSARTDFRMALQEIEVRKSQYEALRRRYQPKA